MGARRLCGAEQVAAADALPPSPSHDWRLKTKQPAQQSSAALSILDLGYFFERAIILRRKVLKKSTETHDILPERKKTACIVLLDLYRHVLLPQMEKSAIRHQRCPNS